MKLPTVHLSSFSCYFIPVRSKYSPQHPVVYTVMGKILATNEPHAYPKIITPVLQFPGQDLNTGPPEYEACVLTIIQGLSVPEINHTLLHAGTD
jgi:hypothetical protein